MFKKDEAEFVEDYSERLFAIVRNVPRTYLDYAVEFPRIVLPGGHEATGSISPVVIKLATETPDTMDFLNFGKQFLEVLNVSVIYSFYGPALCHMKVDGEHFLMSYPIVVVATTDGIN